MCFKNQRTINLPFLLFWFVIPSIMPLSKVEERLVISAWSLFPFLLACVLLALVVYSSRKGKPITKHGGLDAMVWLGAAVVFFGGAFGMMFLQLPGVDAKAAKSASAKSASAKSA